MFAMFSDTSKSCRACLQPRPDPPPKRGGPKHVGAGFKPAPTGSNPAPKPSVLRGGAKGGLLPRSTLIKEMK
jgi:hypothetical protein